MSSVFLLCFVVEGGGGGCFGILFVLLYYVQYIVCYGTKYTIHYQCNSSCNIVRTIICDTVLSCPKLHCAILTCYAMADV